MLTLDISQADIERLSYERYAYPCVLVQKRLHTLYLKSETNLSHGEIAQIVGIHRDTVTDYIRMYNEGELEAVCRVGYTGHRSALEGHSASLLEYFGEHPPMSVGEARAKIIELTGLERSPTQVRAWMLRHGLRYRKTGQVPAKADRVAQEAFVGERLAPLVTKAESGEIHLLFLDAAHFVMGVFLCFLWSAKRVFIKSSPGRKRYNVLGAVDAVTKHILTLTNEGRIDAAALVEFLYRIRIYYHDMKPIYIVLDNARYQKTQWVRYLAFQLNIKLVYLPPYSPNLNIIERLWKWVKKEALYAKYYEKFEAFKKGIDLAIDMANHSHKKKIESLLNLKFQYF